MARYIDRKSAFKALEIFGDKRTLDEVYERLEKIPTADVVERKKGKWVFIGGYGYQFRCSVCHTCAEYRTKFCSKCGAQMEE